MFEVSILELVISIIVMLLCGSGVGIVIGLHIAERDHQKEAKDLTKASADSVDITERCADCRHCLKLYVPPCYTEVPTDRFVCDYFREEEGEVMYINDDKGFCECFSKKRLPERSADDKRRSVEQCQQGQVHTTQERNADKD